MSITLYPGIAFSPQAELTDNIGAADTIIPVSDAAAFPEAPNLATIGTDEEGETILYTAKTANALSGCRRGVEGTAKSWQAGELIGRNFTAKDHADLIAAVREAEKTAEAGGVTFDDGETFQEKYESGELVGPVGKTGAPGKDGPQGPTGKSAYQYAVDGGYTGTEAQFQALLNDIPNKQPKLRGSAGQVVGFNTQGAAVAVSGWSNPNLLENWYFQDPVNQRGQEEYAGGKMYCIDRLYIRNKNLNVSLVDRGIKIQRSDDTLIEADGSILCFLNYRFENHYKLLGRTVTMSALIDEAVFAKGGIHFGLWQSDGVSLNSVGILYSPYINQPGLYSITIDVPESLSKKGITAGFLVSNIAAAEDYAVCRAWKLEYGTQQTLAHQDADGNWVLNDPPPDKVLELLKCQRYYRVLDWGTSMYTLGFPGMVTNVAKDVVFQIPNAVSFRAIPSVSVSSDFKVLLRNHAGYIGSSAGLVPSSLRISTVPRQVPSISMTANFDGVDLGDNNVPIYVAISAGKLIFDANL